MKSNSPPSSPLKKLTDSLNSQTIPSISASELAATEAAQRMIQASGENPFREGLQRTPERFAKAWNFLNSGYRQDPKDVVGKGIFQSESKGLIVVKEIEFYSLCEHHMLPFWGKVNVGYYPNEKILGLSKIPRLINLFSRRLQVQERLTQQIADTLDLLIQPRAVAVRIQACHLCMMMRGVEKQGSHTLTETQRGFENLNELEKEQLLRAL